MREGAAVAMVLALLVGSPARGATPAAAPATTTAPAPDPLKAGFEALPEPERRAIQDALLWTSDYVGVVSGAFGPRTRDALAAFTKKAGLPPDAILDPKTRARLMAAAASARAEVGFAPVKDKPAGVTLSLPLKLLPRKTPAEGGTRYASADGTMVVDTLSRPAGPGGLAEVFDRMSAAGGQRSVTYKLLKPDFFVVSGEIADRKFYSRFVLGSVDGQALIRGLTLAYPKLPDRRLDAVVLATAASFEAFPAAGPGLAATTSASSSPTVPPRPATFALTAIRIDPGMALTHLPGEACVTPTLAGAPIALRSADKASGLALFDIPPVAGPVPVLGLEPVLPGASLLVLFGSERDGLDMAPAEVRTPGEDSSAGTFTISAGVQGRAEGTPVIDREGRLAGLATEPRRIAPTLAGTRLQNDYPVLGGTRLKAFLDQAGVTASGPDAPAPGNLGAVGALWRPRLLRIVCQVASAH